jgi:Flp pilus assembly protein TadG
MRGALAAERGQATVELVGMVPLLVVVVLAVGEVLAAGAARSAASSAAEAAAIALVQGTDPAAAARAAAPGWTRERVAVRVAGRRVRVRIAPPGLVPGTAHLLVATAVADAGPAS